MSAIEWSHLLEDLTAKRDALNSVIEVLTRHFIREIATPAPSVRRKKTRRLKSVVKAEHNTTAILSALRHKSPQRPGELAKVLKIERSVLAYRLKPLLKSGAIVASGATANREFSLPRTA